MFTYRLWFSSFTHSINTHWAVNGNPRCSPICSSLFPEQVAIEIYHKFSFWYYKKLWWPKSLGMEMGRSDRGQVHPYLFQMKLLIKNLFFFKRHTENSKVDVLYPLETSMWERNKHPCFGVSLLLQFHLSLHEWMCLSGVIRSMLCVAGDYA